MNGIIKFNIDVLIKILKKQVDFPNIEVIDVLTYIPKTSCFGIIRFNKVNFNDLQFKEYLLKTDNFLYLYIKNLISEYDHLPTVSFVLVSVPNGISEDKCFETLLNLDPKHHDRFRIRITD